MLPAINFLRKKLKGDGGRAKARLEVQKALKEFLDAQKQEKPDLK